MKKFLLATALTFAPATAFAHQAAPAAAQVEAPAAAPVDADPAMWVVRDDDTTIYLFGTFHMLDRRPWFNDEVKTAFDGSDELVLEAILPDDPASIAPMIQSMAMDQNGRTLSSRLNDEQKAQLTAILASLGAPPTAFDQWEPWYVAMALAVVATQKMGISGEHGAETILTRAARERNMPIGELESVEQQLRMMDNMPEPLQLAQLGVTLEQFENIAGLLGPMLEAWSTGDAQRLAEILNDGLDETPELFDIMLTRRNAAWAEWIDGRLDRPGTVFIAVGAGHLAGRESVQALLEGRGIASERVPGAAELQPGA